MLPLRGNASRVIRCGPLAPVFGVAVSYSFTVVFQRLCVCTSVFMFSSKPVFSYVCVHALGYSLVGIYYARKNKMHIDFRSVCIDLR